MATTMRQCSWCWRVGCVDVAETAGFVCSTCRNDSKFSVDSILGWRSKAEEPLVPMLWSVFPHSEIQRDIEPFRRPDGRTAYNYNFVVPEYRLAIDFVSDHQVLPVSGDDEDEDVNYRAAKVGFDEGKQQETWNNNYRWITLPLDVNEARSKLLQAVNEVYVKHIDGHTSQVLSPKLQGDAGWDLVCDETVICPPGVGTDIPSQVYLEIPNHLYAIVQARSSTSKKRLLVLPGVIDPAYRGQIFTMTFNPTTESVIVNKGDRISQLLFFYRIPHLHINPTYELRQSERGSRGFGSTGG